MGSPSFRIRCAEPRTWLVLAGLCAALVAPVALPTRAFAQGTPSAASGVDRARAAYDRGVRANAAGDHANAARAFAEADSLAPASASLEAALESAMKADDAALGADLVERADGRAPDAGLRKTLEAARRRFAGRTGRIRVECHGDVRCLAAVDGAAADARRPIHVAVGPHAVVLQRGEERIERLVDVKADAVVVVDTAPVAGAGVGSGAGAATGGPPTEPRPATAGLSRGWFYGGLGVTAVFGAITIVSGLDANRKHDRFVTDGCGGGTGPVPVDCADRGAEGTRAETRTNIFLGATALFAVTTAALGIFAVRWRDGTQARLTFGGARASASAGFEIVTP